MGTFLEEVKRHNPRSTHLLDRIISQMSEEDANELREALMDEEVKLVAIRKALANRGFVISQAHLSGYRTDVRNGVR